MKIKSVDVQRAIKAALEHSEISAELDRRNDDERLDCRYVKCEVTSLVDAKVSQFTVTFNYEWVRGDDRKGEDIIAYVIRDDQWRVKDWESK